ncbi:archaeal proteasome endopeptidase complex subunit beta [Methermicoccus shengliensis]|uniref:Proteasome subunit beta n=1 Tax=Methermicoccus shengliensis TaxID=660064 RepID=A0A832RUK0_9EURY|nr:archaeal proteasome endopeptidase complex subunit beta [Methermicoccus shengliensis]KUK04867.1 MAG: Proteasome subunit beta [Euryarchaeota archaeon 55_53]KUK30495.1 MAG: Proteasome subunit beta [Methanosarcinales archeaon 56_1174]MDI3487907.1 proteasome beta subunit [Methanosarcinales archaeon]MDN5295351.1 proteasome beta subunit [Methanosarcinales archaeon]HIH69562.1 archaeal proteasome endopeptidase complex subunit beta [Methermicoccus shengliensis]
MNREEGLKGTTTVGLVCKDGVVLATERRATMGTFIASREAKKIYQLDDKLAMTTAGSVGDAQQLARIMAAEAKLYKMRRNKPMSPRAASTLLANVLSGSKYFPFLVQLLVGGLNSDGPSLFSLDPLGGQIEERRIAATGSGSLVAYGVLEDRYTEDIMVDEGVKLAIRALHTAMKRDAASGDGIEVIKITQDGFTKLSEEEVNKIREVLN